MRIAALVLLALAAAPAAAQPYAADTDCKTFSGLTVDQQLTLLATIPPFGDDIEKADEGAAKQWAREVSNACVGHPDSPIVDVAADALGG